MTFSQYFLCFIIYGFFGWIYESIYYTLLLRKPVNTGFLHVCFCPIYGFACTANIAMFKNTENGAVIFIVSLLVISAIEYIASALLEELFGKRWWDYGKWPLNLNGRISLFSSLAFGAMSLVQMRLIQPSVEGFVLRISDKYTYTIIALFLVIIALDLTVTLRDMDKEDEKLWFVKANIPRLRGSGGRLAEKAKVIADKYRSIRGRRQ